MKLRFIGSGDAFGSGGRFNTCFLLDRGEDSILVDCGASSLVAMRRFEIDPRAVGTVVLSHLHGDHFGGLPFLILDGQLVSRRTRPLVIAGPPGLPARLEALMEAMFPGSWSARRRFALELVELTPEASTRLDPGGIEVEAFTVSHPSGSPSLALRIAVDGRIVAYTGDTEWVEALVEAGRGADLLIAECYGYDRPAPYHLDLARLRDKLPLIGAKRVIATHMSRAMLDHLCELGPIEAAADGLEIEIA